MKLTIQDQQRNSYALEIEGTPETITLEAVIKAVQAKDKSLDTIVLNSSIIYGPGKENTRGQTLKALGIKDEGATLRVYNNYDNLFAHCDGGLHDDAITDSCYFSRNLLRSQRVLSRYQINPPNSKAIALSRDYEKIFILNDGNVLIKYYDNLLEIRDPELNQLSTLDITQVEFPTGCYDKNDRRFTLWFKLWPINDCYFLLKVSYRYIERRPRLPCNLLFVLRYDNSQLTLVKYSGYNFNKDQSEALPSRLYDYLNKEIFGKFEDIGNFGDSFVGIYDDYMGENYAAYRNAKSPNFIDLIRFNHQDHSLILEERIKLQEIIPRQIARFNDGNLVIAQDEWQAPVHPDDKVKQIPPKIQVYQKQTKEGKSSFQPIIEYPLNKSTFLKKLLPKLNSIIVKILDRSEIFYTNILSTHQIRLGKDDKKEFIERPLKIVGYIKTITPDGIIVSITNGVMHIDKIVDDDVFHDALKGLLLDDLIKIVCDYLRPRQTIFAPISQPSFFGRAAFRNPLDDKSEKLHVDIISIIAPLNNSKTYHLCEKIACKLNSIISCEPAQLQQKIELVTKFIHTLKSDPENANYIPKLDMIIDNLEQYAKKQQAKGLAFK